MKNFIDKRIFCYPGGLLKSIFRRDDAIHIPSPLQFSDALFYKKARWALWDALKILRLKKDDVILFPSYHCGIELSVILAFGIQVQFYRVNTNLEIDTSEIRKLIKPKTKALFIIHYFGIPHDMISLISICREFNIFLIEDCAQALYSKFKGKSVGSCGDVAIFSMRKTVPLPSGGALIVNNPKFTYSKALKGCICYDLLKSIYLIVERDIFRYKLFDFLRYFLLVLKKNLNHSEKAEEHDGEMSRIDFSPQEGNKGMSKISLLLFKKTPHNFVVKQRRMNFFRLQNVVRQCDKVTALIKNLPENVCPPFFPVVPSNDPESFLKHFRKNGVWADYLWPQIHSILPINVFPEAVWLKSHVIVLPVHHELSLNEISIIQEALIDWEKGTSQE